MNSRGGETRDGGVKVGQILLERRGLNGIRKECVTGKVQVRLERGERDETRVFMWKGDDDWGCMKKLKEARWKEGRRRASQWWCHHDHIQMDVGVFNPKQISHLTAIRGLMSSRGSCHNIVAWWKKRKCWNERKQTPPSENTLASNWIVQFLLNTKWLWSLISVSWYLKNESYRCGQRRWRGRAEAARCGGQQLGGKWAGSAGRWPWKLLR